MVFVAIVDTACLVFILFAVPYPAQCKGVVLFHQAVVDEAMFSLQCVLTRRLFSATLFVWERVNAFSFRFRVSDLGFGVEVLGFRG